MWAEFYLAIIVTACALYVPGVLFWRGLGFSRLLALCFAPVFSVFMYSMLPIAYYELGIPCRFASIAGPTLVIGTSSYIAQRLRRGSGSISISPSRHRSIRIGRIELPYDQALCLLYVAIAALVCAYAFLAQLSTPESFVNRLDNQTHINLARSFLDSGKWSTLHTSKWLASPECERPYLGNGGFYPSAWHCLVALACSITGLSVPAAMNALLAVVRVFVFPLGELCFMRALFPHDRRVPVWGAVTAAAFANWPWHITATGPLFPNILGLSLLFCALGIIVIFVDDGFASKAPSKLALVSTISFLALAIAHPNTIFSAYIFFAFYGATVIAKSLRTKASTKACGKGFPGLALMVYAALIVGVWVICYQIPLLSDVINFGSTEKSSPIQAIAAALTLRFSFTKTQYGMMIASICGLIALAQRPDRWRIVCPICFFALAYVATRSGWPFLKYWTSALWYSDRRRLAINLTLFLMPVAALGLDYLWNPASKKENSTEPSGNRSVTGATSARLLPMSSLRKALVCVIVAFSFCPSIVIPPKANVRIETPLGSASAQIAERYENSDAHVYGASEVAFVNKVLATIPKNALVINSPGDGSVWAYGTQGLNIFFRTITIEGSRPEARILKDRLCDLANDGEVQDAARRINAQYVLLLDKDVSYENGSWLMQFNERRYNEWSGINSINDDTPGFELVLSEGSEMRLYRILSEP